MTTNNDKKNTYELDLAYLYPNEMNLYGDYGNVITLQKRCEWRDINLKIHEIGIGDRLKSSKYDIFFMGGGTDSDQIDVFNDLLKTKKDDIVKAVEDMKVFLLICGGYQLFGKYFLTAGGKRIKGLGILDIETIGGNTRCIGNISTVYDINDVEYNLVGFENHSGQTIIGKNLKPLGKVVKGFGNNTKDETEGVRYKNIYATYMHGSFLPKNPAVADEIIRIAIGNKYGQNIKLKKLDDSLEEKARQQILNYL